jgi:hypothetical protein
MVIFIPIAIELTLSKMFLKYDFGVMRDEIIAPCARVVEFTQIYKTQGSACRSIHTVMRTRRNDPLLNRSIRLTIVGTISIIALAALILLFHALFDLIARDFSAAGDKLAWGVMAAIASLLLIRYRNDLIDA